MKFPPLFLIINFALLPMSSAKAEETGGFAAYLNEKEKEKEPAKEAQPVEPEKKDKKEKKKSSKKKEKAPEALKSEKAEQPVAKEVETPKKENQEKAIEAKKKDNTENAENSVTSSSERSPSTANASILILKTAKQCFVVELHTLPSGEIACKEPVPLRYTKRDCGSSAVQEIGETEAQVSCGESRHLDLLFRTSDGGVNAGIRPKRQGKGRAGITTSYAVESANEVESSLLKLLPAPKLISLSGDTPEESPLKLKFSGFASLEWESTRNFGFNGTSAQKNFDANAQQARQNNMNFFTNFGFEAARDRTSFVSLFEIGELYFGDTTSGGGQGGRATNVFEVRNLYLDHRLNEKIGFKGGLITTNSDPRAFIFSDHLASAQADYKTDLSEGLLWYGEGQKNRPGAAHKRDQYLGGLGTLGFLTGMKATVFGVMRWKDTEDLQLKDGTGTVLTGDSKFQWLGTTVEAEPFGGFTVQGTAIANWISTKVTGVEDSYKARLLDLRLTQQIAGPGISVSMEGLSTSGGSRVTDPGTGKQIQGRRGNFVSPIGASYLLSLATSDGADDSPGTPKESIIGNLNLEEGLQIGIAGVNATISRKISGFLRYGYLDAANGSFSTGQKHIGDEVDVGAIYQLTPSTSLQGDFAHFRPGNFFDFHAPASLGALKLKFSF